jgi:uncharacterized repeat protein (TIGR03803 family)
MRFPTPAPKRQTLSFWRALALVPVLLVSLARLAHGDAPEVLHRWPDSNQAWANKGPHAPLMQARDGTFYGTTFSSGPPPWDSGRESGTIFKMTAEGEVTTIATFSPSDGQDLNGLLEAADGALYGTAEHGGDLGSGLPGYGTVFKMTPDGTLSTLVQFNRDNGADPKGTLIQGPDRNFYGVTVAGGVGYGTVYQMTPDGSLETLVKFNQTNGSAPFAGLILGIDGNLYGTTMRGGAHGAGTIFRVTLAGLLTTLYSFQPSGFKNNLVVPNALVEGGDGSLYGTTQIGGIVEPGGGEGMGTIFKLDKNNVFTELYSFHGPDGAQPDAGLIKGHDASFYGITNFGGDHQAGTLFRLNPSGAFEILLSFDPNEVAYPGYAGKEVPLLQGNDLRLYGIAFGPPREVTVFRFTIPRPALPPIKIARSGDSVVLSWPASAVGAVLESINSVPGASWSTVRGIPARIADQMVLTTDIIAQRQFFRLRQ